MRKRNNVTIADVEKLFERMSPSLLKLLDREDCLHMGFHETTDLVATEVGIDKSKYVLDVYSGLGSSPIYIASKYKCKVVGLDITVKSIEYAKEKGVDDLVEFHVGNALDMPFPANHFDAAFSEGSLCHVGDKGKVVEETARVLKPGERFCFTDFIWSGEGEISDEFLSEVCAPMKWPYLESFDGYKEHFKQNGLILITTRNRNDVMQDHYKKFLDSLHSKMEHLIKALGQEGYDWLLRTVETAQKHGEIGNMESWLITVRKPL